jgi:hypothetical protein
MIDLDSLKIYKNKSTIELIPYKGVQYVIYNLTGIQITYTKGEKEYLQLDKHVPDDLIQTYINSMFKKIKEAEIIFFEIPLEDNLRSGVIFRYFENAAENIQETEEIVYRIEKVTFCQSSCCVEAVNILRKPLYNGNDFSNIGSDNEVIEL